MKLEGKIAVVIGGTQGIGESVAKRLAADGANVGVVASASLPKAQAVADAIKASGGNAFAERADVTDADALKVMVARIVKEYGGVDIMVNCAGVWLEKPALDTSEQDFDWCVDTCLKGAFFMASPASPLISCSGLNKKDLLSMASSTERTGGRTSHFHRMRAAAFLAVSSVSAATRQTTCPA